MVANAALLGLVVGAVAKEKDALADIKALFLLADLCGISLSVLWIQALRVSSEKISRWIALLTELEPEAFGNFKLFRDIPHGRARRTGKRAAFLFMTLWGMLCFSVYRFAPDSSIAGRSR